jgi:hypothetical protein
MNIGSLVLRELLHVGIDLVVRSVFGDGTPDDTPDDDDQPVEEPEMTPADTE